MPMTLSSIQDAYYRKGYRGARLRAALARNPAYRRLVTVLRTESGARSASRRELGRYVLSEAQDMDILQLVKRLERRHLSASERAILRLIRTQLEADWRTPLLRFLRTLDRKYCTMSG